MLIVDVQLDPLGLMDPLGECPAVEVFKFRDKDGYFGQVLGYKLQSHRLNISPLILLSS